jgi:hypothetical protein
MGTIRVPHIKVTVQQRDAAGRPVVKKEQVITVPAGESENALVRYQTGAQVYEGILVRRKANDAVQITERGQVNNRWTTHVYSGGPGETIRVPHEGQNYEVTFQILETFQELPTVAFAAPKASVTAEPAGWRVTFEPQQYPCVLTCAVEAHHVKDEALPSFPFPSNPRYRSGSFVIPYGQFSAQEGGLLRLGVRGAGLQATVPLPPRGASVSVAPQAFEVKGAAQPEYLAEQYVVNKHAEKAALIRYTA